LNGWRLLRVTPDMVDEGEALTLIEEVLGETAVTPRAPAIA